MINGGMPSVILLRRNDSVLTENTKERYRKFLARKLAVVAPNPELELDNQQINDAFYEQCGNWLRENTRDVKKFDLLFSENVTYGFRRNLFGLRRLAIGLNLITVVLCIALLWKADWSFDGDHGSRISVILLVAFAHVVWMTFGVRQSIVWEASNAYARQLLLSCELFLNSSKK